MAATRQALVAALALVLAVLLAAAAPTQASIVTDWNALGLRYVRSSGIPPPKASRAQAMLHAAIFDAINGITSEFTAFMVNATTDVSTADVNAAVAAAARDVLNALFPQFTSQTTDSFNSKLLASGDPSSASVVAGLAWGSSVASAVLAARANDGSATAGQVPYGATPGPGVWVPTPPAFAPPLLPGWGSVKPFGVPAIPGAAANPNAEPGDDSAIEAEGNNIFAQTTPPYPLGSTRYAKDVLDVYVLGDVNSTVRTDDQTNIAMFWAQNAGVSTTPPGLWQKIATQVLNQQKAQGKTYTLANEARLFAQLTAAQADAAISCWWTKFTYNRWRPVTAIMQADPSTNRRLVAANPDWRPFLPTPPFPTYTSGHSTFSGASAKALALWFGRDNIAFTASTDWVGVPDRSFKSFSAAADEAGRSRIYGGIHFQQDNVPALKVGGKIAKYIFKNKMRPVSRRLAASSSSNSEEDD